LALSLAAPAPGQTAETAGYQKAPPAIRKILDIPPPPAAILSSGRDYLVLAETRLYPPIADLARPVLRLAGLRIDPRTNGPQLPPRYTSLTLRPVRGGKDVRLELPPGARPGLPVWSPDGKQFAVLNTARDRVELYLGGPESPRLRKVEGLRLNA